MSADPSRLKATLDELHRQLADLDRLDPATRGELTTTLHEIQTALGTPGEVSAANPPLIARLREAAQDFEESHPAISGTLGSLIDTLGRMGI